MTRPRHGPPPPPKVPLRGTRGNRAERGPITNLPRRVIALSIVGVFVLLIVILAASLILPRWLNPTPSPALITALSPEPATPVSSPVTAELPTSILPTQTFMPTPTTFPLDLPTLQQYMLTLINADRRAQGLTELSWDTVAGTAGQRHAQEMAQFHYLSHWNLDGFGPDYRYSLAGGLDTVRENVFMYSTNGDAPASLNEWKALIQQAETAFMNSPHHRENLLAPEHTQTGIGIAYDPVQQWLAITQEFADHYVALQALPNRASLGDTITVSGHLLAGISDPVINLAYEPLPTPKTVDELNATGLYQPPTEAYQVVPITPDSQGRFSQPVPLNNGAGGLYHIRIGAQTSTGIFMIVADVVIAVQ